MKQMKFTKEFNKWISGINKNEKPKDDIIAFWFGLFESANGYTMYLIGSKEFDKNDDDWACNSDFEPKNKYFDLPSDYVFGKNWETVLNDSLSILTEYISSNEFNKSIFKDATAIAVGFDDGDLHRLK